MLLHTEFTESIGGRSTVGSFFFVTLMISTVRPGQSSLAGVGSFLPPGVISLPDIRCYCGDTDDDRMNNGQLYKLRCFNETDGDSYFEERICHGDLEDLSEVNQQECVLPSDKSIEYGDWIGACRITDGDDYTDQDLCSDRTDPTGVVCKCNNAASNAYVDCYKEDSGCIFARHWCDHEHVCTSDDQIVPYGEWYQVCQLPQHRDVPICSSKAKAAIEDPDTNVICNCRGIGNSYDCYGPDGCLYERNYCAPDEECSLDIEVDFLYGQSGDMACKKGYTPISAELGDRSGDQGGSNATSIKLIQSDWSAYYYCVRPGSISCNVTYVNPDYQNLGLNLGIFGIPYSIHQWPYYQKILSASSGGVKEGQSFQSIFNENSYGVYLDINNGERLIFSDDYINHFKKGFKAEYSSSDLSTRFVFTELDENAETTPSIPVIAEMVCEGFRPLTFFQDLPYDPTTESCERDADESYYFRKIVWPTYTWQAERDIKQQWILTCISGTLSFLGSSFIVFAMTYKWARYGVSSTRVRLLLGLSIMDLFASLGLVLGPAMSPSGAIQSSDGWDEWYVGNTPSCDAQGFMIQLGFGVPLYNSSLCIFYMLVLVFMLDPSGIKRWVEVLFHVVPITFALGTASTGVALELFNTNGDICWIEPAPYDCRWNEIIDCSRGSGEAKYIFTFAVAPVTVGFIIIIISMTWITYSVVRRRKQQREKSFVSSLVSQDVSVADSSVATERSTANQRNMGIFLQCSLYVFSFAFTYIWVVFLYLGQWTQFNHGSWLNNVVRFFWPLQGFWNFFIFLRPTYNRVRKQDVSLGFFRSVLKAMKVESTEPPPVHHRFSARNSLARAKRNQLMLQSLQLKPNYSSSFSVQAPRFSTTHFDLPSSVQLDVPLEEAPRTDEDMHVDNEEVKKVVAPSPSGRNDSSIEYSTTPEIPCQTGEDNVEASQEAKEGESASQSLGDDIEVHNSKDAV